MRRQYFLQWEINSHKARRGSRGGEMGEFSPPFFWAPSFFFFLSLKCWPQTPQPGFGSIILLQKFTPHFKILDPRLKANTFYHVNGTKYNKRKTRWKCCLNFLHVRTRFIILRQVFIKIKSSCIICGHHFRVFWQVRSPLSPSPFLFEFV